MTRTIRATASSASGCAWRGRARTTRPKIRSARRCAPRTTAAMARPGSSPCTPCRARPASTRVRFALGSFPIYAAARRGRATIAHTTTPNWVVAVDDAIHDVMRLAGLVKESRNADRLIVHGPSLAKRSIRAQASGGTSTPAANERAADCRASLGGLPWNPPIRWHPRPTSRSGRATVDHLCRSVEHLGSAENCGFAGFGDSTYTRTRERVSQATVAGGEFVRVPNAAPNTGPDVAGDRCGRSGRRWTASPRGFASSKRLGPSRRSFDHSAT